MEYFEVITDAKTGEQTIRPYTQAEIDAILNPVLTESQARKKRDELLAATDWWAVSDRIITTEQLAYRQALRDITLQPDFPSSIVWPEYPTI